MTRAQSNLLINNAFILFDFVTAIHLGNYTGNGTCSAICDRSGETEASNAIYERLDEAVCTRRHLWSVRWNGTLLAPSVIGWAELDQRPQCHLWSDDYNDKSILIVCGNKSSKLIQSQHCVWLFVLIRLFLSCVWQMTGFRVFKITNVQNGKWNMKSGI